jgi:hypothetical protein
MKDKSLRNFNSNITSRNGDGTVVLSFESIGAAIPRGSWPDKWNFDLYITRLKTDANYREDDPLSNCSFIATVVQAKDAATTRAPPRTGPATKKPDPGAS